MIVFTQPTLIAEVYSFENTVFFEEAGVCAVFSVYRVYSFLSSCGYIFRMGNKIRIGMTQIVYSQVF